MWTPDRQITPDDDKPTKPCNDCNGCGEIIEWDEDDIPEPVSCPTCKGVGEIEIDETDNDEW
jgi:DnaJ-class molecular chaperone